MTADLIETVVRMNLAAGVAILVVLAGRKLVRALFGPQAAYALWSLPPVAALAGLMPAARADEPAAVQDLAVRLGAGVDAVVAANGGFIAAVWLAGAVAAMAVAGLGQWRFVRKMRAGEAGPAIMGVLFPRIVMPRDFDDRFSAEERALVRAHERAHIERGDARVSALAAALQCLAWFNPLVHVASYYLRLDQELACDATVLARLPHERRRYAQTMLKTQLASGSLPFGCYWPARGRHPLEERIASLNRPAPQGLRLALGGALVAGLTLAGGIASWAAQPPAPPRPEPERPQIILMDLSGP